MLSALRRGARQHTARGHNPGGAGPPTLCSDSHCCPPTQLQAWHQAGAGVARWLSGGTDLKARFAELLPGEQARCAGGVVVWGWFGEESPG